MINLKSHFKDILILYIKFKRSQGYNYEIKNCSNIRKFDELLYSNNIVTINEDLINKYCLKKENEKGKTTYMRQCFCKDVCAFIKNNGYPETYIFNKKYIKYEEANIQYIYTDKDIEEIFKYIYINNYPVKSDKYFNENFRVLITLFYTTGIRRAEGFNLKFEDINHEEKLMKINNSKNNVSRIIPLSNSVYDMLKKHIDKFKEINNEYIFLRESGKIYGYYFNQVFVKILDKLNIKNLEGKSPRIHDFRFTFAVTALNNMEKQQYDLYHTLPFLQTYMGHQNIKSTEYYLKYTDKARENIMSKLKEFNNELYAGEQNE